MSLTPVTFNQQFTNTEKTFLVALADLSYSNGDILYYNSGALQRLPIGSSSDVLVVSAGLPAWSSAGASGANTALSNLASVSINTSLLAQTGVDLGSTSKPFRDLFLFGSGTFATTYLKLTGTPTSTRTWTIPDSSDTFVGKATTDTLTNKTYDTAGAGNVFKINGTTISATTGSGSAVLATSPTLTTAALGSSTATTQSPADNSTKVATTAYVDNAILGQRQKEAVKYASITALPSIIYSNGSSGVGATLTGVALAAISLDSSSPAVADRVLIKNQVSDFQNGIYTVTATGSGAAVFVLTRATDFDQSSDIQTGDAVFVTAGNTLANTTWTYNGIDSPTMGTTSLTFVQSAGPGSYTAGNGIAITGTSVAIDTSVTVDKTTAQTLTNKTLTSPKINEAVALTTTATKLNYLTSATGTTGTASTNIVFSTSPSLTTPALGVATATSINGLTVTSSTGTLTITNGKTLSVSKTLTLDGTDSTTMTFPSTSATIARTDAANTFTGTQTFSNAVINTNNAITASGNAATVPVTAKLNTVTNNSAATLTITMTTASATDGQMTIVRILDFSGVAQTITWVNTENSTQSVPTTSNGSTTLFLTVGFIYNGGTSKWRCIASA